MRGLGMLNYLQFGTSSSCAPHHTNITGFLYNQIRTKKFIVIIVDTSDAS